MALKIKYGKIPDRLRDIVLSQLIKSSHDLQTGLDALVRIDPRFIAPMRILENEGMEIPLRNMEPGLPGLVRIITSQLVSRESATAIFARLQSIINPINADTCLAAGEEQWIAIGMSRPKQKSIRNVAEAIISGELEFEKLHNLPPEGAMELLTTINGIGPWSAQVYALFCICHRDIFPAGDLALRKAAMDMFALPDMPSIAELEEMATSWQPWRGCAARVLWTWASHMKSRA